MTPFKIFLLIRFLIHLAMILSAAAVLFLIGYIFFTKGPADFAASDFAQKELSLKYGNTKMRGAYEVISFQKDINSTRIGGIYKIHFFIMTIRE